MALTIRDCFDENGYIKFDPYRCEPNDPLYSVLFWESGNLKNDDDLADLIDEMKWSWECDAVGLYHAQRLASSTKGSYPTIYYFR